MSKVGGTPILGTLEYAKTRGGEAADCELREGLAPASRATLRDGAGRGDLERAREVGKHVAFQDANRFLAEWAR